MEEAKASGKVSTLYLSTSQISTTANQASASNQVGYWQNGRQQFGFNVKLRQLLGDAYEKHDKFMISLTKFSYYTENVAMPATIFAEIQMGGLSWVNSGYEAGTKTNGYWVTLDNQILGQGFTSTGTSSYADKGKSFIFKKGDQDVLVEFRLLYALSRLPAIPATGQWSSFSFEFKIRPLLETPLNS